MKIKLLFYIVILSLAIGCTPEVTITKPPEEAEQEEEKTLLVVDFKKDQTLRYKFLSERVVTIELGSPENAGRPGRYSTDKTTESAEYIVAYKPLEINPYGISTVRATCEYMKTKRSKGSSRDAIEYLAGKSFTFKVGPTGKIEDYSELDELLKKAGEKAFQFDPGRGRIKNPDMIGDFVVTQWFLWDSISGIDEPSQGLTIGQTWNSQLSVPSPMVMRKARDVTYKLEEIIENGQGRKAIITGTYAQAESVPRSWPIPYSGRFQMVGPFGFYRNYRILNLSGGGRETFNIDQGRTEQYEQQYKIEMEASLIMPLADVTPKITIEQKITMELVER